MTGRSAATVREPAQPANEAARAVAAAVVEPGARGFESLARLVASVLGAPYANVSLVDRDAVVPVASYGLPRQVTERRLSFCGHTILSPEALVVTDASSDERFRDNPLVAGGLKLRFYAGERVAGPDGEVVGTVCGFGPDVLEPSEHQRTLLSDCARLASELLRSLVEERARTQHSRSVISRQDAALETLPHVVGTSVGPLVQAEETGVICHVDPAAAALFGVAPSELVGEHLSHLFDDEDVPAVVAAIADPGGTASMQARAIRRDGSPMVLEMAVTPVPFESGRRLNLSLADVTAQLRSRDERDGARRDLGVVCELAPVGIYQTDAEGMLTFVNRRWCRLTGFEAGEALGRPWDLAIPSEQRDEIQRAWERSSSDGVEFQSEWSYERGTRTRWVIGRAIMLTGPSGEVTGYLGAVEDMTSLRSAREELRSSEELYRSIMETMYEGVSVQDTDGTVIRANASAARILGLTPDELLGRRSIDPRWRAVRSDGSPLPGGEHPAMMALSSGQQVLGAIMGVDSPGLGLRWLSVNSTPIGEGDDGRARWVVSTFTDVSERERLDRMKNEFVSTVSHELRTPLTSIRGSLGILAGGALGQSSAQSKRLLGIANNNAERLVRLIDDILDIEKLDGRGVRLDQRQFDLGAVVAESLDAMGPVAADAGVELRLEPFSAPVWVDPDRITQTMTNLVSNAVKFSARGASVRISAVRTGDEIEVAVADDGRGIPEDKLDTIFERFRQIDASDSRAKDGTGLGLAICRAIVAQHGGRIWATSELGTGSTFRFTLPILTDHRDNGGPDTSGSDVAATQGHAPGERLDRRHSVIIVEDDADLRDVLTQLLATHQIDVEAVGRLADAREALAASLPDLVLLDVGLPDGNGLSLLDELRDRERPPAVIVYTVDDSVSHAVGVEDGSRPALVVEFHRKGKLAPDQFARHVIDLLGSGRST